MTNDKIKAFLKRAIWTFLQAFLAVVIARIPEGSSFSTISWQEIFEVAFVAGLLSVAKSLVVGVPEVTKDDVPNDI